MLAPFGVVEAVAEIDAMKRSASTGPSALTSASSPV